VHRERNRVRVRGVLHAGKRTHTFDCRLQKCGVVGIGTPLNESDLCHQRPPNLEAGIRGLGVREIAHEQKGRDEEDR
jgi:hypothetical protein